MPVIIAALLRQVLMAAITVAAADVAAKLLEWINDKLIDWLKSEYGLSDDDAVIVVANEVLVFTEQVAGATAILKARVPVRVADRLGLSAKGATKRTVSATGSQKVAAAQASSPLKSKIISALVIGAPISLLNAALWFPSLVQNILDQGTFNPQNANRALDDLGLPKTWRWSTPERRAQPGPFDANAFQEYYDALTIAGAIGINAEYASQSQPWNKNNLADLVLYITGQLEINGAKSTAAEVKKRVAPFIIKKSPDGQGGVFSPLLPTTAAAAAAGGVPTQIKIYTGVVANGALGTPQEFIARPDDMIQNVDELRAAAKNNLAALYQALPGRFYYEIAIVASVRTRAGFTVKGAPVSVVSGYQKNGTPRYKTIYHKFAIMRIFVTDVNGRNVKLQEITLGPVNVVDFQPTSAQLADVAGKINPETFTGDVGDVKQIITSSPVTVTATPPANPAPATAPAGGVGTQSNTGVTQVAPVSTPASPPPAPPPVQASSPAPATAPVAAALTPLQQAIKAATNLTEFYRALGQDLPPLNMRANYYQANGLGAASTYAGTAEQNNRMLALFKQQAGVA